MLAAMRIFIGQNTVLICGAYWEYSIFLTIGLRLK